MKLLSLENSTLKVMVDSEDYDRLKPIKWYINHKTGYVYGYITSSHRPYIHRFILGLSEPKPYVDHKDGNPLNCQRSNLRYCTDTQNVHNQNKRKIGEYTSKFKGVAWGKRE